MSEEIWKDIPGYEGRYQVSNFGRVKSLEKIIVYSNGKIKHRKERILKPTSNNTGYLQVDLWTNNKPKARTVHSLVLESFVGPRPEGMDVCHNDGNNQNNHLDNLRYDTRSNNIIDCVKQQTHGNQRLSADDVKAIRELLDKKELTQKQIARMYNIDSTTVHCIKTHKLWGWLTV